MSGIVEERSLFVLKRRFNQISLKQDLSDKANRIQTGTVSVRILHAFGRNEICASEQEILELT